MQEHTATFSCDNNFITITGDYDNICDVPMIRKSQIICLMHVSDGVVVDPETKPINNMRVLPDRRIIINGAIYIVSFKNGRLDANKVANVFR